MTNREFDESAWADGKFSRNYLEKADVYIVDRRRMFEMLKSFYRHFFGTRAAKHVLDLGCGDGILTRELLSVDGSISATLVDGSVDMLETARAKLGIRGNTTFVCASFEEILSGDVQLPKVDIAVSSLAIHHLVMEKKRAMFGLLNSRLKPGGYFLNIDVVLAPSDALDSWYMHMWKSWMENMMRELHMKDESPDEIIGRYRDPSSMNTPDTLVAQLEALKYAGFDDVDCYYKNGIFAMFGGRKKKSELLQKGRKLG